MNSVEKKRLDLILKAVSNNSLKLPILATGIIKICKDDKKEWGTIEVTPTVFHDRRNKLIDTDIWISPLYSPHISIFNRDEVIKLPDNNNLDGQKIEFSLTGLIMEVKPERWKEVSMVIYEVVDCQNIINIRRRLGLSDYLYGDHEYHITLGVKYKEKPNL